MARAGGCLAGILGGSILRGIVKAIGIIFKAIVNILVFTGLWILEFMLLLALFYG